VDFEYMAETIKELGSASYDFKQVLNSPIIKLYIKKSRDPLTTKNCEH